MNAPRILITRTRHQASELAAALERLGAETILIPTIEVIAPTSFDALDAALRDLSESESPYDWLIFTSANAVIRLAERAQKQGIRLFPKRIAVIGPATAKAVAQAGLKPQGVPLLLPERFVAETLAEALLACAEDKQHYLLVRAEEARDVLPSLLEAAGHRVTIASAYRNVTPPDTLAALGSIFASADSLPNVITFTSSSTARNLITLLESIGHKIPQGIALASIGPITSRTLREFGYEPTFEADVATIDSLVSAISKHLEIGQ